MAAESKLVINEIYRSLQGESSFQGLPCVFIRLTGCDLRCTYCDTEYAFHEGEKKTLDEILSKTESFQTHLVEITGGEPLLQEAVHPLMKELCDHHHQVLIETSGAHDISTIDPRVIRIMDLKTPSSGESEKNLWANMDHLRLEDEVKFVIGTKEDFAWSVAKIREHSLEKRSKILFSAIWGKLEMKELAEWTRDSGLPIRFQAQLHKILWGLSAST